MRNSLEIYVCFVFSDKGVLKYDLGSLVPSGTLLSQSCVPEAAGYDYCLRLDVILLQIRSLRGNL